MNRSTTADVLAVLAAAFGVVSVVTRPFLFAPIGLALLLAAVRTSRSTRFTVPALCILSIGALAGTAIAAAYTNPLY